MKELVLKIPGFSIQEKVVENAKSDKKPLTYSFFNDSIDWYQHFENIVLESFTNKKYLPVFRLSDGEFIFILGRDFNHGNWKQKFIMYLSHVKNVVKYMSFFYSSGRKGYCEHYKFWEVKKLQKRFLESLRIISKEGVLNFNFSNSVSMGPYFTKMLDWLNKNQIDIDRNNYFHFYFVYGVLLGPISKKLYSGSKILVVTSDMKERNLNLSKALYERGAVNVEFLFSSLNHPLRDKISVEKIKIKPDLVLVGAGVGAAYILTQLRFLNCPVIDAGYVVDCLGDKEMAKKRPYTVPDSEWDLVYGDKLPKWL